VGRINNHQTKGFFSSQLRELFHSMLHRIDQLSSQFINNMAVVFDENVPNINLYTAQTPNGIKISITLEELGYGASARL